MTLFFLPAPVMERVSDMAGIPFMWLIATLRSVTHGKVKIISIGIRLSILPRLRYWIICVLGILQPAEPDLILANSNYIADKIKRYYQRDAKGFASAG